MCAKVKRAWNFSFKTGYSTTGKSVLAFQYLSIKQVEKSSDVYMYIIPPRLIVYISYKLGPTNEIDPNESSFRKKINPRFSLTL